MLKKRKNNDLSFIEKKKTINPIKETKIKDNQNDLNNFKRKNIQKKVFSDTYNRLKNQWYEVNSVGDLDNQKLVNKNQITADQKKLLIENRRNRINWVSDNSDLRTKVSDLMRYKTNEKIYKEVWKEKGLDKEIDLRDSLKNEARNTLSWIEAIDDNLKRQWLSITKTARNLIMNAKANPLREQLQEYIKWIEISNENINQINQDIMGVYQAKLIDREEKKQDLYNQIEQSDLSEIDKKVLKQKLNLKIEEGNKLDWIELYNQKKLIDEQYNQIKAKREIEVFKQKEAIKQYFDWNTNWLLEEKQKWKSLFDLWIKDKEYSAVEKSLMKNYLENPASRQNIEAMENAWLTNFDVEKYNQSENIESWLTPNQITIWRKMGVELFWKRAWTKPENLKPIFEDLRNWLSPDEIQDKVRTWKYWLEYTWAEREAFENISSWMSKERTERNREILEDKIQRYGKDDIRVKDFIKKLARDKMTVSQRDKVIWYEALDKNLNSIKDDLDEYERLWGSTWIFSWKIEDLKKKAWLIGDKRKREVATRIAQAIMNYRASISWAAFTEAESREYADIFPSINNVGKLNSALINAVLKTNTIALENQYWQAIWPQAYRDLFDEEVLRNKVFEQKKKDRPKKTQAKIDKELKRWVVTTEALRQMVIDNWGNPDDYVFNESLRPKKNKEEEKEFESYFKIKQRNTPTLGTYNY